MRDRYSQQWMLSVILTAFCAMTAPRAPREQIAAIIAALG